MNKINAVPSSMSTFLVFPCFCGNRRSVSNKLRAYDLFGRSRFFLFKLCSLKKNFTWKIYVTLRIYVRPRTTDVGKANIPHTRRTPRKTLRRGHHASNLPRTLKAPKRTKLLTVILRDVAHSIVGFAVKRLKTECTHISRKWLWSTLQKKRLCGSFDIFLLFHVLHTTNSEQHSFFT